MINSKYSNKIKKSQRIKLKLKEYQLNKLLE